MNELNLCIGTELLSIRSSDIAFTMGAKGPLLEKLIITQAKFKDTKVAVTWENFSIKFYR